MMGSMDKPHDELFYAFKPEYVAPQNHLLRDIWGDGSSAMDENLDVLQKDGDKRTRAKNVSQTDAMARWTAAPSGPTYFAYSTNYRMDIEIVVFVDVEATTALRSQEVASTKTMIERVKDCFGFETRRLIGDKANGTAELLNRMAIEQGIEPHVQVWDKGERDDGRSRGSDFIFDDVNDLYTWPNGKELGRFWRNYMSWLTSHHLF